jgi:hypothetical protein
MLRFPESSAPTERPATVAMPVPAVVPPPAPPPIDAGVAPNGLPPAATFAGKAASHHAFATTAVTLGKPATAAGDSSDAGTFIAARPGLTPLASEADETILNLPNRIQRENASLVRASAVGRHTDGLQIYVRSRGSGGDGSVRMATLAPQADLISTLKFSPRHDKIASLQVILDGGGRIEVRPTGRLAFPRDFNARNLSDRDVAFLTRAQDAGLIDDGGVLAGLARLEQEGSVGLNRADLDASLPEDKPWLKAGAGLLGALGGWGLSRLRAGLQVAHDPHYPLQLDKPLDQWGSGSLAVENNAPVVASGGHFMDTAALASLLPGVVANLYADIGRGLGPLLSGTPRADSDTGVQDQALGQISQGVATFVADLTSQDGGTAALRTRLLLVLGEPHRARIEHYLAETTAIAAELKQPDLPDDRKAALRTRIGTATRKLVDECGQMPSQFRHDAGSAAGAAFKSGYAVYLLYLSGEEFEVSKNPKAYLAAFNPFMAPVATKTADGGYATRNDWAGDVTIGNMPGAAFQIVSENLDKDGHIVVSASGPLGIGGGGDHTMTGIPLPTTAEILPDYVSRVELRNDWGGASFGAAVRSAVGQSGPRHRDILGLGSPVDFSHEMSGGYHAVGWGIDPNSPVNRMKAVQPGSRMWTVGAHFNPGALFRSWQGTMLQNLQVGAELTTGKAAGQHVDPANPYVAAFDAVNAQQTLLHLKADLPLADLTGSIAPIEADTAWADVANYLSGGINAYLANTRVGVSYGYNWGTVDPLQHAAAQPGGQFAFTTRTQVLSLNGEESTLELVGKIGWGLLSGLLSYGSNTGVAALNAGIHGRGFGRPD